MPEVFLTEKEKFEGKVNKCMERLNEFIFELFSEHHCNDYPTLSYYPFVGFQIKILNSKKIFS